MKRVLVPFCLVLVLEAVATVGTLVLLFSFVGPGDSGKYEARLNAFHFQYYSRELVARVEFPGLLRTAFAHVEALYFCAAAAWTYRRLCQLSRADRVSRIARASLVRSCPRDYCRSRAQCQRVWRRKR